MHAISSEITRQRVRLTRCEIVAPGVALGYKAGPTWTTCGGMPCIFLTDPDAEKPFLGSVGRMPGTRKEPGHFVLTISAQLSGKSAPRRRQLATLLAAEYALLAAATAYATKRSGLLVA